MIYFMILSICFGIFSCYLWLLKVATIEDGDVSWNSSLVHTVVLKKGILELCSRGVKEVIY